MIVTTVIGNPKLASRTRDAAERVAEALSQGAEIETIELAGLATGLLGRGDPAVAEAVRRVQASGLVIFASPTFKASYSGLLKLFLEQFDADTGLAGVVAVPLMLGGAPHHALAPSVFLAPILNELGALTLPGLYLIDSTYRESTTLGAYAERWAPVVRTVTQE